MHDGPCLNAYNSTSFAILSHATAVKPSVLHTKRLHCYTATQSINCIAHCSPATVGACTDHTMACGQPC
jgi:hypothetical protein